jgi:hypothetical protein
MMKWMEYVAHVGVMRRAYNILVGKSEGRDHLDDQGVNGRIMLERIFGRQGGREWIHVAQNRDSR